MAEERLDRLDAQQKALAVNLEPTIYGTIAEIGAGQEVARTFLQAGGASGTIAKTVSAYDMTFSDAIYGKVSRYVSRERVDGMLEHEYTLLLERLAATRGPTSRFFVFADSVSARNFAGTNECHGWIGLRFQHVVGGEPSQIVLHVNLLDPTNLLQQQAVGVLGVNLIHAAYFRNESMAALLAATVENVEGRVEIDLVACDGAVFAGVDERRTLVDLVRAGCAEAVLVPREGRLVPPSEVVRKRAIVLVPGVFSRAEPVHHAMLRAGCDLLSAEHPEQREPLPLFVLATRHPGENSDAGTGELVDRAEALRELGASVLIVGRPEVYNVVGYLLRYTSAPIRISIGSLTVADVLQERYYGDLDGALMEALARLFAYNVRMYVHPMPAGLLDRLDPGVARWIGEPDADGLIGLEQLSVAPPACHLLRYLVESRFLRPVARA
ncbi:MAG: hypothetical protein AB1689_17750 [Thermodesulfobacteriota bacterium]